MQLEFAMQRRVTIKPGHTYQEVAALSRMNRSNHKNMFVGDEVLQPCAQRLLATIGVSCPFCLTLKSVEGIKVALSEDSVSCLLPVGQVPRGLILPLQTIMLGDVKEV